MSLTPRFNRRRAIRAAMFAVVLCFPLLGAGECNLAGVDDSESYDGTYNLVAVHGRSVSSSSPYDLIRVDANNRLVLWKGVWTLSGTTLSTEMYTYSYVNGVKTTDPRFNPERHTGRVTVSGGTATGTLDTGSSVSTTFATGTMLTTYSGHQMKFEKQ